jgi:hypothetical protein
MRIILKYNNAIFMQNEKQKLTILQKIIKEKKKVSEPMNQFAIRYEPRRVIDVKEYRYGWMRNR